jgi:hypothetical protein
MISTEAQRIAIAAAGERNLHAITVNYKDGSHSFETYYTMAAASAVWEILTDDDSVSDALLSQARPVRRPGMKSYRVIGSIETTNTTLPI